MSVESAWPRGRPLRLEGVTVRRGPRLIFDRLDLSFEPGRRYVLIGASGSGKTTLLRLLNRLDDPDDGRLMVGETALVDLPVRSVRAAVGLVFQSPRPLPGTLLDNLAYPHATPQRADPRPVPTFRARPSKRSASTPDWLDRDASGLSGGERQRLAIATALGLGTRDPCPRRADLGPRTRPRPTGSPSCSNGGRGPAGLRTIVVTHNREQAARLGDWTVRLEGGRVVDQGPTARGPWAAPMQRPSPTGIASADRRAET